MTRFVQPQPINQQNTILATNLLETNSPICAASWCDDLGLVERNDLGYALSDGLGSSLQNVGEKGFATNLEQADVCNRRVKDLDNSISIPKVYQIVWPAMQWEHPLRYG